MLDHTLLLIDQVRDKLPTLKIDSTTALSTLSTFKQHTFTLPTYVTNVEVVLRNILVDAIVYEVQQSKATKVIIPLAEIPAVSVWNLGSAISMTCKFVLVV
jgi:hypothetical protein